MTKSTGIGRAEGARRALAKRWGDPIARFWSRVDKTGSGGCWIWHGKERTKPGPAGYGRLTVDGKTIVAHRYSWKLTGRDIPDGMNVLHRCDVPLCVNPEHLFLGTQLDNIRDSVAKGRTAKGDRSGARKHPERLARGTRTGWYTHPEARNPLRGEQHPMARFSTAEIISIRERAARGESQRQIASEYGRTAHYIHKIVRGLLWKSVGGPISLTARP